MSERDHERDRLEDAELLGPGLIHEMRHPLMGIKAGLELVSRRLPAVGDSDDWDTVTAQVARLEELFRTYQDLFSPERVATARFAIEPVVQRSVDLLAYRVRKLGARFELEPPKGMHYGLGAATSVLHALTNLIVNAIDAVEERGGESRVLVRIVGEGPLEVRVSDDGPGIPPQIRERLFTPRVTTKPEGKGTGLGLHIARIAMSKVGGAVRLVEDDDPARLSWARTEFVVQIPLAPEAVRR